MEHSDLVAEMAHVEHLSTQDRLHLARRRRIQQLKTWTQREKEWQRQRGNKQEKSNKRNIFFSNSVMLLEAASRNDIAEVRRLLMKGVSADSTNEDGLTALHQCCIDDNEEMMMLLLEYGANVNAEDSEKWTPLHAAATCGHLHLVKYLIGRGANLLAVNADGNMPYDICEDEAALDHIEGEMARRGVTQELIDDTRAATELAMLRDMHEMVARGEDIEAYDRQGATPLHIAAANGYLRVVEYLLEQQVATGCKDRDEWQPVHAAACWGHLEVLELLVDKGADLNAKTKHDETPADICEDPELRERIVQLRSEQETRRQQDYQQRKGVHRTQSNTRTQSVRRTSIRDKTLTTKKDTVEEARLRFQEVFVALGNKEGDVNPNTTAPDGAPRPDAADAASPDMFAVIPSGRRAPEGKDNDDDSRDEDNHVVCRMPPPRADTRIEENGGDYNPSNKKIGYITDNGNVMEINVTVTINSGSTLADIKKQRSLIRNTNSPTGTDSLSPSGGRSPVSEPPPAIEGPKRFTGNTGDMVGDSKTKRCCVVS